MLVTVFAMKDFTGGDVTSVILVTVDIRTVNPAPAVLPGVPTLIHVRENVLVR